MDFDEGGTSELHQFVVLAQSAKGAACAALIREVLSHPKIFVFGELLALPNVQELANTEHAPVLELLNTFAFGTWGSLTPVQASQLDESQASKLKKLTLVSMCASAQVIPYDTLMRDLGISSVRALEDLVISLIYEGLLQAKLDQRSKQIEVHHAIGRDVHPDELAQMEAKLRSWCARVPCCACRRAGPARARAHAASARCAAPQAHAAAHLHGTRRGALARARAATWPLRAGEKRRSS